MRIVQCLAVLVASATWALAGDLAVPDDVSIQLAVQALAKQHKAGYADTTPEGRCKQARVLIDAASTDAKFRYAELLEAERLALRGQSVALALEAAGQRVLAYHVDRADVHIGLLRSATQALKDDEQLRAVADAVGVTYDQLIADARDDKEAALVQVAGALAKKLKDKELQGTLKERLAAQRVQLADAVKAQRQLEARLVAWCVAKRGVVVGRGECMDVVCDAIEAEGGVSSSTYNLGRRLYPGETPRAGDVLHMQSLDLPDSISDPHHVAMITKVLTPTKFECLHANWAHVKTVEPITFDVTRPLGGSWQVLRVRRAK